MGSVSRNTKVRRGELVGFSGSWSSGIGILCIQEDGVEEVIGVPCENAPTVRCLSAFFPGLIRSGHTVNVQVIKGERVVFAVDDLGVLATVIPESYADSTEVED